MVSQRCVGTQMTEDYSAISKGLSFFRARATYVLAILLVSVMGVGAYMVYNDVFLMFSKLVGSGHTRMVTGDYSFFGTGVESVGVLSMANSEYRIDTYSNAPNIYSKLASNLESAHCYPNPYKPNSTLGHTKITFTRLTDYVKIMIFNIAGELVFDTKTTSNYGEFDWDVVNNAGERVASGVYIYVITNDKGNKKIGKFGVIR